MIIDPVACFIKKGVVFDIKRFAVDDGPGIRTTVFLKGCPLRCWWCHNPEGQLQTPELMFRKSICTHCDECVGNCERNALSFAKRQLIVNKERCSLCGLCAEKCPTDALTFLGKELTVKEVMREVEKDSLFYDESKGGVTFSGGEPLMQIDFLDSLLTECKARGVRTAVDTSGYAPWDDVERIAGKVDFFLYDIKVMDDRVHRKYTGVSNTSILDNFRRLAECGSNLYVRVVVVPGINDDKANVRETAEFVKSCGVKEAYLLPYHKSGIEKYRGLGRTYKLGTLESPSDRKLKTMKGQFERAGLSARIGGG
jgi:pyruvate formate lyase activating enzyme